MGLVFNKLLLQVSEDKLDLDNSIQKDSFLEENKDDLPCSKVKVTIPIDITDKRNFSQ